VCGIVWHPARRDKVGLSYAQEWQLEIMNGQLQQLGSPAQFIEAI